MLHNKKIIAILPAYNAAKTLQQTLDAIPRPLVDDVILVDDKSVDDTVAISESLGIKTFAHKRNRGYGGNQKTCYREALLAGADVVVMVHPDFQYDPKFIPDMVEPVVAGRADAVFGSRMMHPKNALNGGMPKWKWIANIILTKFENLCLNLNLTEYHSGFRAYSRAALELPIELNSDNFVFDTEIIAQLKIAKMKIEEIPISTRYFPGASMIGFVRSVRYGLSIVLVMAKFFWHKVIPLRQFMLENVSHSVMCPICGNTKSQLLFEANTNLPGLLSGDYFVTDERSGVHGELRECLRCRTVFVPMTKELSRVLDNYYGKASLDTEYLRDERGRRFTVLRLLRNFIPGKLLDFGANVGFLMSEVQRKGWTASGVEASAAARKFALTKHGLTIEENIPDKKFNLITILDVLEHVVSPKELICKLSNCLEPNGMILIAAPDISSLAARTMGRRWYALLPGHLFFFSRKSIEFIADSCGLKIARRDWYVRFFSIGYLASRLLRRSISIPVIGRVILPVTFFDEPVWTLIKES